MGLEVSARASIEFVQLGIGLELWTIINGLSLSLSHTHPGQSQGTAECMYVFMYVCKNLHEKGVAVTRSRTGGWWRLAFRGFGTTGCCYQGTRLCFYIYSSSQNRDGSESHMKDRGEVVQSDARFAADPKSYNHLTASLQNPRISRSP